MTFSKCWQTDTVIEIILVHPGPNTIQNHARADRGTNKNLLTWSSAYNFLICPKHIVLFQVINAVYAVWKNPLI